MRRLPPCPEQVGFSDGCGGVVLPAGGVWKGGEADLKLPQALYETLSIYLLLAIGLKGGIELSKQPLAVLAPQVAATMALGFVVPLALFPLLRALRLAAADSAALAAHYGSVSVVTFAVALAALAREGIALESHAALWVAVMEAPA
jgi:uncharacterized protein